MSLPESAEGIIFSWIADISQEMKTSYASFFMTHAMWNEYMIHCSEHVNTKNAQCTAASLYFMSTCLIEYRPPTIQDIYTLTPDLNQHIFTTVQNNFLKNCTIPEITEWTSLQSSPLETVLEAINKICMEQRKRQEPTMTPLTKELGWTPSNRQYLMSTVQS